MFAVIYKGYVHPGKEALYQKLWNQVAQYFIDHQGAVGSCLHKTAEGEWIAYSRWPDKMTRDAAWPPEGQEPSPNLTDTMREAILQLKNCIDRNRPFHETCMEVVNDLLL